jgi:hypothetical protein
MADRDILYGDDGTIVEDFQEEKEEEVLILGEEEENNDFIL